MPLQNDPEKKPHALFTPDLKAPTHIAVKQLGLVEYKSVWDSMKDFTQQRDKSTPDELWIVEHPPVFTLGRSGKSEHILQASEIPIIKVDRGGQVTYHGPGQVVIYLLLDLHRRDLGIRHLVSLIEDCIIELLSEYDISASNDPKAPGVYVDNAKIAALGLRVSKGCTTHGLSLNVNMDLTPFSYINPCGYSGLKVTQTRNFGVNDDMSAIAIKLQLMLEKSLEASLKNN